ncbi:MAG: hypothetical protein IKJ88_08500 [Clostridia bacterium]|nr:hypothetical protein [Clostridia bacterium]
MANIVKTDEYNEIINQIDITIKKIWEKEIKKDYKNRWLLKEDTLKNAFYFHLRKKLGKLFDENDIRIFTEFTDAEFKGSGCIPDMVIAKVDFDKDVAYWGDCVTNCIAVIEFKFKHGFSPSKEIYADYKKMRRYANKFKVGGKLYMATIWEYEDDETAWENENNKWAKDKLVELNASYERDTEEMRFYIKDHGEHN